MVCVCGGGGGGEGGGGAAGGICSSDRYMIHLYSLSVHAGVYSEVVEYSLVTHAARARYLAAA